MSVQRERILAHACELYLGGGASKASRCASSRSRSTSRRRRCIATSPARTSSSRTCSARRTARSRATCTARWALRPRWSGSSGAGEGFLDFAIEHPRWYTIMHTTPESLGWEALPEDVESMGYAIHQFWNDRVRECMEAGILKRDDPEKTSLTMWAHARGMVSPLPRRQVPHGGERLPGAVRGVRRAPHGRRGDAGVRRRAERTLPWPKTRGRRSR